MPARGASVRFSESQHESCSPCEGEARYRHVRSDLVRVQLSVIQSEVCPRGLLPTPRRPTGLGPRRVSLNDVRGPAQALSPAPLHGCGSIAQAALCKVR